MSSFQKPNYIKILAKKVAKREAPSSICLKQPHIILIYRSLVDSVLNGFNGTIFAYGQTGTGKTFTMEGVRTQESLKGVIPRSFDHIFTHISRTKDEQYLIRASYLEIYQEEIR